MKLLLTGLLLTQLPLFVFLLQIPWSADDQNNLYQKQEAPITIEENHEPTLEYEQLRRRIKRTIIEFWHAFSSELDDIQKSVRTFSPDLATRIVTIIQIGREYQRAFRSDLEGLEKTDGFSAWREREAAELSELMQLRLSHLQNPKDCNSAPKLVIPFVNMECDLHMLVFRFIIAYATQRTLIIDPRNWCFNKGGWEVVFHPLSDTCTDTNGSSYANWPHVHHAQVVMLPASNPVHPRAPYFPRSLPSDLAPRLKKLHGNPYAWWIGQFLKYILRSRDQMDQMIVEIAQRRGLQRPFVGVHIRRTRNNAGAKFIPIEDYMTEVEEYFQVLELSQKVPVRRVYLASDDPRVILEAQEKYSDRYEIFTNAIIEESAATYQSRFTNASLMGITLDIFFLSLSDYLVCTFSSHTCRTAYELMQIFHPDASDKAYSLDMSYFFNYELDTNHSALYPHKAHNAGEISFKLGEEITEILDLRNGYSTGMKEHNRSVGWFPSFKVGKILQTYDFPTYPHIAVNKNNKN